MALLALLLHGLLGVIQHGGICKDLMNGTGGIMAITEQQLKKLKAPFQVTLSTRNGKPRKNSSPIEVVGFTQNDPLGVGGRMLPDIPVVHFKGGSWITLKDLMRYYCIYK